MQKSRKFVVVSVLVFTISTAPVKADSIDPCEAWKQVSEVIAYLELVNTPDFSGFSLQDAVALGQGSDLLVSTKNLEFDLAFGNVMAGEERGLQYKLSRYFTGGSGRDEFIAVLEAAGYVKGRLTGPTFWGSYQNLWQKKDGWKDPCSGGGGGMAPQLTASFNWINLIWFMLAILALEVFSKGRFPVLVVR